MLEVLHQRFITEGEISFAIRVHPSASQTKLKGVMADGTLKIDIAAAPEDGKANTALIAFLATEYGVPRSHVEILRGQTGKRKVVRVRSR